MPATRPEFWIDVGGTFTDCLVRDPSGSVRTHKLLSTGVYKSALAEGSDRTRLRRADSLAEPPDFFVGWTVTLLATSSVGATDSNSASAIRPGDPLHQPIRVIAQDAATRALLLAEPLPLEPLAGLAVELSAGLDAPVAGIRFLLGRRLEEPVGPIVLKLGTTRGTNALLERKGARTALVTTRGFADILRIGTQNRPRLFDLAIRKAADLYEAVAEIDERLDAAGDTLLSPDPAAIERALAPIKAAGIDSLAVCLMQGYRRGDHEDAVAAVAEKLGFGHVSRSSRLSPTQRIVPRGDTTVVDAYLTPILRDYAASIRGALPEADFFMMTSAGGLVRVESFVGKDSVLSGPAGGVVGVAGAAMGAGFVSAVGFDMGGTSTDVCRIDHARPEGPFERRYLMEVNDPASGAGVRIVAPMLSIETVAAGGGSICWFDGLKIRVGPESAGSRPGPACYGRGGPLAVTDINVFLGKVLPDRFAFPLDRRAVEIRLDELIAAIRESTGREFAREELAVGFEAVANANMAAAIRKVSVARGHDVRGDVLVSFGGAGGQHACALARELGIRTILQHPYAGILSAYGIGMAEVRKFAERHVGRPLSDDTLVSLEPLFLELEKELRTQVEAEGVPSARIEPARRLLDLRYLGQDAAISVPAPFGGDWRAEFERRHRGLYGFIHPTRTVEILALRLEVAGATWRPEAALLDRAGRDGKPERVVRTRFASGWRETPVHPRDRLIPGRSIVGPAIITESLSTVVVEPGWSARLTEAGDLLLELEGESDPATSSTSSSDLAGAATVDAVSDRKMSPTAGNGDAEEPVDPVLLELFNNRFASIAEQMGETLRRTSLSTNVKERLDFSCAVFTATGGLVVNAPHIPVHLGAMGRTVECLIRDVPDLAPGDVLVTNDPYRGGSHLPDVTVVTPVFAPDGELLFFTGSRAHHAEIGGIVPGSMPPFSTRLAEEGVLIRAFRLVERGVGHDAEFRDLLTSAPYPSRSPDENLADVHAQVAANRVGADLLLEMLATQGRERTLGYMGHIRAAAATKMRRALGRLPVGARRFEDRLDNGRAIAVTITIRHDVDARGAPIGFATVDFTGTGPVSDDNQNANPAIVRSAVLYSFRCLIDEDIPLNDGVLDPVTIIVPEGTLLSPPADPDPARCPAVGGGNVETSQRVVDVVLGALGVAAASQGTMNNFLFGRPPEPGRPGFGYYETIGGGGGAGPGFVGASAVHTHMTNTRITDPEVLEARYPVRVRQFSIRRGSGGAGRFAGGDGMIRELEFLEPLDVSLVTNRRQLAPFGLAGGSPGSPGRNRWLRATDRASNASASVDSARAETPSFETTSARAVPVDPPNRAGASTAAASRVTRPPVPSVGPVPDGAGFEDLASSVQTRLAAGDILRLETPGGGGYGEPTE
jgi:5-oxoprolinase (ATP-hydrolysing)